MIYVVGIGPGHRDYMLKKGEEVLKKSDYVIGFKRAVESIDYLKVNTIIVDSLKETLDLMESLKGKVSIIASGDPLFYGIVDYLKKNTEKDINVIPGISSFQYLSSKIGKCWNGAYLGSMHGRCEEFLLKVKEHKKSFWLTDKKNTPKRLCEILIEENIKCNLYIGENLSYEDEKIWQGTPLELVKGEYTNLSVIMVEVI
ncbi:precorrin-6y C5,15-methyltransferase (decarboxylating) subunit CbiE [Clostridium fallax]|uniref:Precorrin-6Y C5,15-methyltransferase (Decarboxylating) n=1 Tax=Clostridium fallax TaxID=1533 RepID=A0A1M4Y2C3_9CLOT|nr:precorrin-6y C5,15-methyltransferase (decarboxylating) subunit CbiE [Clostridium fallax]SHE99855.1 precorrin-6Y C5,15-methyltransferase (decarboxylating) [Clostridium fallax]SQB07784.1 precorrin-6y C5,15-methyltransferase subunit CbiE [Clostridium fallax]